MARQYEARVAETSTTTGTGSMTVAGAIAECVTFASVCAISDTFYYAIQDVDSNGNPTTGGSWEVGIGTYSASNTVARTTVLRSSNANALVNFAAGTKQVYITSYEANLPHLDDINTFTAPPLSLSAAAGNTRAIKWKTAGVDRWSFNVDSVAESGSNAGSDFQFFRHTDAGANNGTVFSVVRSSGNITIGPNVQFNSQPTFASGLIVSTLTGYLKGNASSAVTASATIPFADLTGVAASAHGHVFSDITGLTPNPIFGGGAANNIQINGATTGNSPSLAANGTDTNIDVTITPKGAAGIVITPTTAPATTTSKVYNVSGDLYFEGVAFSLEQERRTSAYTNTTTSATNVFTGISAVANATYEVEAVLSHQCSGFGGSKFSIVAPTGTAVIGFVFGFTTGATVPTGNALTVINSLTGNNFATVANTVLPIFIKCTVVVGGTAGTVTVGAASVTGGQTTQVNASSVLRWRRVN